MISNDRINLSQTIQNVNLWCRNIINHLVEENALKFKSRNKNILTVKKSYDNIN
jgi:hypothetical protein